MGSKSTTISLENSSKKVYLESTVKQRDCQDGFEECSSFGSRVISEQSNYELEGSKVECSFVLCGCHKQKWKELVNTSISIVKTLIQHHF
jgi:hypothetical protein